MGCCLQWSRRKLNCDFATDDEVAAHFSKYTGRKIVFKRLAPNEVPKADNPPPAEGSSKNLVFKVDVEEIRKVRAAFPRLSLFWHSPKSMLQIHPKWMSLDEWLEKDWVGRDAGGKAKM